MQQTILDDYTNRAAAAAQEADKFKRLANTYSLLRLGIFALIFLAVYLAIKADDFTVLAVAVIILLLAFAWLVSKQAAFEKQKQYFLDVKKVNDNEIGSVMRYGNIYYNGGGFASDKHYYAADLDIFGPASLFQLVNRAATSAGNKKLATWLEGAAVKGTILSRQAAVKEITQKNDWKIDLQATLLFANGVDGKVLDNLFTYIGVPLDFPGEKLLSLYSKITPYILVVLAILAFFFPVARTAAVVLALLNVGIVSLKASYIRKTDLIAGKIGTTLDSYSEVFRKIETEEWASQHCSELAQLLKNEGTSASIKELSALITRLNYHLNLLVGFALNAIFLWDIRQIIAIENWKRKNDKGLQAAFDVIAEFEALMSISSLAINYSEWAYPVIADGEAYTLIATNLAHPLINQSKRVENNYMLDDTFKIDIITGSNMAGKSTFLRTIGVNVVLTLCGAPVCADAMTVSVINIFSYMRIKDSLNESTSTFKAELDRLQMLLAAVDSQQKIFFLVDEMLRGTNSMDKYLGSKAVIEQLISKNAVGLVATHDLQIAELEAKYPDYIRNFYFDIQVKDGEMLFDYKMKPGECKTFNASLLLKQIGINVDA